MAVNRGGRNQDFVIINDVRLIQSSSPIYGILPAALEPRSNIASHRRLQPDVSRPLPASLE